MPLRCELFIKEMLPSIRKELSKILYDNYKMSQEEIADKLSITQSAVSQYLNGIRGKSYFEFDQEDKIILIKMAELLKDKNIKLIDLQHMLCQLCEKRYKYVKCYIKV
jgi:predicted transcriptional regulator